MMDALLESLVLLSRAVGVPASRDQLRQAFAANALHAVDWTRLSERSRARQGCQNEHS